LSFVFTCNFRCVNNKIFTTNVVFIVVNEGDLFIWAWVYSIFLTIYIVFNDLYVLNIWFFWNWRRCHVCIIPVLDYLFISSFCCTWTKQFNVTTISIIFVIWFIIFRYIFRNFIKPKIYTLFVMTIIFIVCTLNRIGVKIRFERPLGVFVFSLRKNVEVHTFIFDVQDPPFWWRTLESRQRHAFGDIIATIQKLVVQNIV
jgi:hypothetical protein